VAGGGTLDYQLEAISNGVRDTASGRVTLPAAADSLRFAAVGDNRTNPGDWAKVAAAGLKARPQLHLHSGDMVAAGANEWQWDEQFFGPAKELFAAVPLYPVIGNHEGDAPLYNELFYTPGDQGLSRNWAQQVGPVLLIGIDGRVPWDRDAQSREWLDRTLAESHAKFIFLVSHYPAWTSSIHGVLRKDGRVAEDTVWRSREVILPLLEKYKATALISGHDHDYERSEPPGGVTNIVSGGGGARLYGPTAGQNPYSKVFVSKLNFCLFEVRGDTCTMKALTPEGELLDTRSWPARKVAVSAPAAPEDSDAP